MKIQQSVTNFTANGQVGPWLKLNYYEEPFDVGLLVAYGTGATLLAATLAIDYILDDMSNAALRPVHVSQATTVITVTDTGPPLPAPLGGLGHGLAVADTVTLSGSPAGIIDGTYAVATIVDRNTYTLTSGLSQTLVCDAYVVSGRVMQGAAAGADNVIKIAPVTARTSFNVTCPIFAVRLHVTAFTTAGLGILVTMQGGAQG